MNLIEYNQTCMAVSQLMIRRYSTSFHLGTRLFPRPVREAISSVYGFVRLADEIVDTFHDFDKRALFDNLKREIDYALAFGISSNPIIQSFQLTVKKYDIDRKYIDAFLDSMEMDLTFKRFTRSQYEQYIYGSAEVIGLMCLRIFCGGRLELFNELLASARQLGSAFQKVNFLRDFKQDLEQRGRIYFPDLKNSNALDNDEKKKIESEIAHEFRGALGGIRRLPRWAKTPVYSTFLYYQALFIKLRHHDVSQLLSRRLRINNFHKLLLLARAWLLVMFRLI